MLDLIRGPESPTFFGTLLLETQMLWTHIEELESIGKKAIRYIRFSLPETGTSNDM